MRKVLGLLFVIVCLCLASGGTIVWRLYRATSQEPEFYQQALLVEPAQQEEVVDAFEQDIQELRTDVRESGEWQAEFTAEELNGWLAAGLPEKFPEVLPRGVENPRVAIEDGQLRVAARFRNKTISSVLSFALQIQLADEPNMLAIRILEVRAGALPLPLDSWFEKVRKAIANTDLVVEWRQSGGDPVALVTIPDQPAEGSEQSLTLENIAIEPGLLRLSGSTTSVSLIDSKRSPDYSSVVQRVRLDLSSENQISHQ